MFTIREVPRYAAERQDTYWQRNDLCVLEANSGQ